jgi:hypothetical protein
MTAANAVRMVLMMRTLRALILHVAQHRGLAERAGHARQAPRGLQQRASRPALQRHDIAAGEVAVAQRSG